MVGIKKGVNQLESIIRAMAISLTTLVFDKTGTLTWESLLIESLISLNTKHCQRCSSS